MAIRRFLGSGTPHKPLTYHIFGEPEPTSGIDDDADAYTVEGSTGQVDAVPTGGWFVPHALLHIIDATPGSGIWTGKTYVLTTIGITGETFVCDTCTLVFTVRTCMTETAVDHVPAMQACAPGKRIVPDKGIETNGGAILINELKELLRDLDFLCRHWWWWPIWFKPGTSWRRGWRNAGLGGYRRRCSNLTGNLETWSRSWVLFNSNNAIGIERLCWEYCIALLRPTGAYQQYNQ